ncbi:hypothetical protein J3D54_005556 [Pseudomonas sp. GGS8]|uniref:hypothetical protein n=1 Tax=Pseudomonas sp. GGS8 TaxID=2817892 RepID=UPI0020A14A66|nr:hypothetical protein [Pseudomonas sp. GGS8]MCP1446424.1 hypothetical protein [Pseudomonas sp. GGS8]
MIEYQVQPGVMQEGISISSLVRQARINPQGPLPLIRCNAALTTNVGQGFDDIIDFAPNVSCVKAFGLLTCAGVILTSTHESFPARAVVYHAPSGNFAPGKLQELLGYLADAHGAQPPLNSILAVYAFPNPADDGYREEALKIQNIGIPGDNIVFIPNISGVTFGINSHGQVGI